MKHHMHMGFRTRYFATSSAISYRDVGGTSTEINLLRSVRLGFFTGGRSIQIGLRAPSGSGGAAETLHIRMLSCWEVEKACPRYSGLHNNVTAIPLGLDGELRQ